MRLAVLVNAYPPEAQGGAGRIAYLQVEALRALGHNVRVWHTPIHWGHRHAFIRFAYHLRDLIRVHPLAAEIHAWQPEWLLTHNLTGIGFRTPSRIQRNGSLWAHLLHDVQLFEPSGQCVSWERVTLWQYFWSYARRFAFGHPDLLLSPTQGLFDAHRTRGFFATEEVVILPNPAPVFQAPFKRKRHTPLRIVFVGRWSADKGSELLQALWSRPGLDQMEWYLIGPGTEHAHPPRGQGYGVCTAAQIFAHFAESDALLVPSQVMENQPTVLLEAMASGLPIIVSNQKGIEETLQGAGTRCEQRDPLAWQKALFTLRDEDEEKYQKRIVTLVSAWQRYAPEVVIQRLVEVLTSKRKI